MQILEPVPEQETASTVQGQHQHWFLPWKPSLKYKSEFLQVSMVIIVFFKGCNPRYKMNVFFWSTIHLVHDNHDFNDEYLRQGPSIVGSCMWVQQYGREVAPFSWHFLNTLAHYHRIMETSCYAHPGQSREITTQKCIRIHASVTLGRMGPDQHIGNINYPRRSKTSSFWRLVQCSA